MKTPPKYPTTVGNSESEHYMHRLKLRRREWGAGFGWVWNELGPMRKAWGGMVGTAAQHGKGAHRHQTGRLQMVQVVSLMLYPFYHNKTISVMKPRGNTEKERLLEKGPRRCYLQNGYARVKIL